MNVIVVISFFAVFFASLCQNKKIIDDIGYQYYRYTYYNGFFLWLSFFILAIGCFVSKSGTDMAAYAYYYSIWQFSDLKSLDFEPGSRLLFVLLNKIIKNPYIGIGVIKIASIFLVFKSIELLREKINIALSVLLYCALIYIYNFHLIRMCLAIGIVYFAIANLLIENEKKGIVCLIIAGFIHYTSIFCSIIIAFTYYFLRKNVSLTKMFVITASFGVLLNFSGKIIQGLALYIPFMSKYKTYLDGFY